MMDNEVFARYDLTRFLFLSLVRDALQADETGQWIQSGWSQELLTLPARFLCIRQARAQNVAQVPGSGI
jgi:hypothetical protein